MRESADKNFARNRVSSLREIFLPRWSSRRGAWSGRVICNAIVHSHCFRSASLRGFPLSRTKKKETPGGKFAEDSLLLAAKEKRSCEPPARWTIIIGALSLSLRVRRADYFYISAFVVPDRIGRNSIIRALEVSLYRLYQRRAAAQLYLFPNWINEYEDNPFRPSFIRLK